MDLNYDQTRELKELVVSPGWVIVKEIMDELIQNRHLCLEGESFDNLRRVGFVQGEINSLKTLISNVEKKANK